MLRHISALILAVLALTAACSTEPVVTVSDEPRATVPEMVPPPGVHDPSSYRQRVFYELWVRSFQDSDGDGVGDFKGLTSRLDELADLGVGGVWLMPHFPSPLADSGYDVADYTAVHPDYGTMADFEEFVAEAHKRNILVYADMVFNHTSDQHVWFQDVLDNGQASSFFEYYVWSPTPATRCVDLLAGPFGDVRWTKNDDIGLYYLHQFYPRQPDLNFESPVMQEALLDVLRFWMDKGVDGFRFDVPDRYFEEGDLCSRSHKTVEFHGRLREVISGGIGKLDRGWVGEIWGLNADTSRFFGPAGDPMIFNFNMLYTMYLAAGVGSTAKPVANQVRAMLADLPEESRWGLFLGNHDTPRFSETAAGNIARQKLAATTILTLPGVPWIWMGDELGLRQLQRGFKVDWRDGTRTPMPWEGGVDGLGFSTATPHLPFAPGSEAQAWNLQRKDPESLLNHYRRVIAVRNANPALQDGSYEALVVEDARYVYRRAAGGNEVFVVHNYGREKPVTWTPPTATEDLLTGVRFAKGEEVPVPPSASRLLRRL